MGYRTWLYAGLWGSSLLVAPTAGALPVDPDFHPQPALVRPALTQGTSATPVSLESGARAYPRTSAPGQASLAQVLERHDRVAQAGELPKDLKRLRDRVRRVLKIYSGPRLNSRDNTPWELLHAIIAYGVGSQVHEAGPDGRVINAIGCLCYNFRCRGYELLDIQEGRVTARKGVGVQGHHGQLLAILAQSHVPADYSLKVGDRMFTVADLVESEQLSCETDMELTFKLISLAHYLDSDATWRNYQGEKWSIQRLIREEIKAPIVGAPCGGTHRLMGLSYAVHRRTDAGKPLTGEFKRAQIYTTDFQAYALKLQNADGSFSTDWFRSPAAAPDLGRRLQTTGHILEWLAYALPEEQLTDPRVVKAVGYLTSMLLGDTERQWEIGTMGHGLHALALYDQRVFKPHDEPIQTPIAKTDNVLRLPGIASAEPMLESIAASNLPAGSQGGAGPREKPEQQPPDESPMVSKPWPLPPHTAVWRR